MTGVASMSCLDQPIHANQDAEPEGSVWAARYHVEPHKMAAPAEIGRILPDHESANGDGVLIAHLDP